MRIVSRSFVLLSYLFFYHFSFAQTCADCRYISPQFDSVTVETVMFAEGPNADGQTEQLYMDIYQPYGDTSTSRAVMIFAFGGGFVQGSRNDWYVELVCDYFARAGYVSAAMDYRLGINIGEIISLQFMRIFFRPMQDMRAAIQFFKADYSELGNNYLVDTSKIVLGGGSAGGISALMLTYCDKDYEMAEMGDLSALDVLGGFYTTSGFYDHYSWKPSVTVNVAGALINADWIEPEDGPVISLHGDADQVVPYKEGAFAFLQPFGFNLQGSYLVDSVAEAKGVCSYLYTMEGEDHPSESRPIEYYKSLVNLLMLRMHAVINDRSFCCPMELNIVPDDTTYYQADTLISMSSQITNDSGSAEIMWCSLPCQFSSYASQISFEADTAIKYMAAFAYEDECQAVDLNVMKEGVMPTYLFEHQQSLLSFSISPNPAGESITLRTDWTSMYNKNVYIEVFDLEGQRIIMGELSNNNKTFDARSLSPGSYLVNLSSNEYFWQPQKLIVVR